METRKSGKNSRNFKNGKSGGGLLVAAGLLMALLLSGCSASGQKPALDSKPAADDKKEPDAVASASLIFYQDSSLDQDMLWKAIDGRTGGCTIATVNEDGSPNLIVAVPGTAGDSHVFFTWAENMTKANAKRTGEAMISYYLYNGEAESKSERNIGARLKLSLETDQDVLKKLEEETPEISGATVFKVEEILPLG